MRNYEQTTNRKLCSPEMLQEAKQKLESGMSQRRVAADLGISEGALRKRLKQGVGATKMGRFAPVFNANQEKELAEHCKKLDEYFYGLTFKDLRRLAYQYAEKNNIPHPFDKETQLSGKDWGFTFLRHHKLSLRTPSKTSLALARIMGFNKVQVDLFFDNLEKLMKEFKFPASRIFNMDESGLSTVPNTKPRVVSSLGKKGVGKVVSAERGTLTTVICAVSASGNYVPPVIIFARKRVKNELMNGAPPDSLMLCSDSGYSNSNLFPEWLRHFQKHVVSTKENPVLLLLDNHGSHISIDVILFCRQHNIHLLSIPPHSSHKIQPLDRCFFKPLKEFFSQMCDKWLMNHPGRVITQYQIAELFGEAYEKCAKMGKGITGFKCCGIFPVNRFVFSEEDFLPSSVTDQQLPHQENSPVADQLMTSPGNPSTVTSQLLPTPGNEAEENITVKSDSTEEDGAIPLVLKQNTPTKKNRGPKTLSKKYVSPSDIQPFPKRTLVQKRKTKKQRSEILTSSPFKEKLLKAEEIKREAQAERDLKRINKKENKKTHSDSS